MASGILQRPVLDQPAKVLDDGMFVAVNVADPAAGRNC